MTHLTEVEMVELLDDSLSPARAAHVDACGRCRETLAALSEARMQAEALQMPEPSPLFWEMFSGRVHEAVREAAIAEPRTDWRAWIRTPGVKWAFSGALLTLLLVAGVWKATAPRMVAVTRGAAIAVRDASNESAGFEARDSAADEEAWSLVRTVADEVSWDDAAIDRMDMRPGSAERAVDMLTTAERTELVRLLEAELKQPGA
jgi:hypothetical protein